MNTNSKTIIADSHLLNREGLSLLLKECPEIIVVAKTDNLFATIEGVQEHDADISFIDTKLPPTGGLETVRRLLRIKPKLKIIAIGESSTGPFPTMLMNMGGYGYVSRNSSDLEFIKTVRSVHLDKKYIASNVAQQMAMKNMGVEKRDIDLLSPRELSVLVMLSSGYNRCTISEKLSISKKTVNTYRSRLCKKLGVSSDVELTLLSIKQGLIDCAMA